MADTVYFGDISFCRAHQYDGYRRDGANSDIEGLKVTGSANSVVVNPVTGPSLPSDRDPLVLFPAAYADLLALALLRQQVPYLLRREGLKADTPWQVLADYLRDKETDTAVREATLLQLAFTENPDGDSDRPRPTDRVA